MKEIDSLQSALEDSETSKKEYIRIKGVELSDRGFKREEIASILGVSVYAVRDWILTYRKYGIEGLRTKKRKNNSREKLTWEQKNEIKSILKKDKPKDVGLKEEFWDVATIAALVKRQYGVIYESIRSYQRLLAYCGYSYQRVEFTDVRKPTEEADGFKVRFKKKLKRGTITMSW